MAALNSLGSVHTAQTIGAINVPGCRDVSHSVARVPVPVSLPSQRFGTRPPDKRCPQLAEHVSTTGRRLDQKCYILPKSSSWQRFRISVSDRRADQNSASSAAFMRSGFLGSPLCSQQLLSNRKLVLTVTDHEIRG